MVVSLATRPHPPRATLLAETQVCQKAACYDLIEDAPFTPMAQEITRVLGTLCQEPETKTKYIFLIISQCHKTLCSF